MPKIMNVARQYRRSYLLTIMNILLFGPPCI